MRSIVAIRWAGEQWNERSIRLMARQDLQVLEKQYAFGGTFVNGGDERRPCGNPTAARSGRCEWFGGQGETWPPSQCRHYFSAVVRSCIHL